MVKREKFPHDQSRQAKIRGESRKSTTALYSSRKRKDIENIHMSKETLQVGSCHFHFRFEQEKQQASEKHNQLWA